MAIPFARVQISFLAMVINQRTNHSKRKRSNKSKIGSSVCACVCALHWKIDDANIKLYAENNLRFIEYLYNTLRNSWLQKWKSFENEICWMLSDYLFHWNVDVYALLQRNSMKLKDWNQLINTNPNPKRQMLIKFKKRFNSEWVFQFDRVLFNYGMVHFWARWSFKAGQSKQWTFCKIFDI